MKLLTAAQMKALDRAAIQDAGISSAVLMETAARQVFLEVLPYLGMQEAAGVAVFCGPGNNGGDGVAAARFLLEHGARVRAFLVGSREKMTEDAKEMERRLQAVGGTLEAFSPADADQRAFCAGAAAIIDAIFGIGLRSAPEGDAAAAIRRINESPAPVIAADIPSGVLADTGQVPGEAVRAACTVTFTLPKAGLYTGAGSLCCGKVQVVKIGIPEALVEAATGEQFVLTEGEVSALLPRRKPDGHKGDFGKVGIVAGSVGYTGAPELAAKAAARSGAGLVYLHVPERIYAIEAIKNTEVMVFPLPVEGEIKETQAAKQFASRMEPYDACLVGPGLGQSDSARALVEAVLTHWNGPLVLDADGLNLAAEHILGWDGRPRPVVLTPHEGEFCRLGGDLSSGDRIGAARAFAAAHGCVLVLKGRGTVTALPDGTVYLNPTGNAGMAKGGSGDVLSGILLALLGQGMEPGQAAAVAVYLHGEAGDVCAQTLGETGMLPSDLISALPDVFRTKEKR